MRQTSAPMPTFEQGAVIRVPFPYTDRPVRQYRPALVVSSTGVGENQSLLWVLMITSAENRRWPGDVDVGERHREMGLPAPSLVRTAKIATIESTQADQIGRLRGDILDEVLDNVGATLRR